MILLHAIGNDEHSNVNTREEIINAKGILTFDGVYKSVYQNKDIVKDAILFVMGDYVGKTNCFDKDRHYYEEFCTWAEIETLVKENNCELGWHTWSHRDLTKLSDKELEHEITPPIPMRHFAYPYGIYDERVLKAVKYKYEKAYSVTKGGFSDYAIIREYI